MLILRIRRAESALAGGRLEEAFDIARADDVRGHARGQKLIGRLTGSLVERARKHLAEGRPSEALADCERAATLGGNLPEVCELRTAISAALREDREVAQRQQQILQNARQHVAAGQLSLAAGLVTETLVEDRAGQALLENAQARRTAAEAAIARARGALASQDWYSAIEAVVDVRKQHAANPALIEITGQVSTAVLEQIRQAVGAGRLDVASMLLARLRGLTPDAVKVHEWNGFFEQCRTAAQAASRGEPRRCAEILRTLGPSMASAPWLEQMLASAQQAAESLDNLRSGPLSWMLHAGSTNVSEAETASLIAPMTPIREREERVAAPPEGTIPSRLLLHVDGVGSFLAVSQPVVRIGPASSSRPLEVPLAADPTLPTITIERKEDDYFLTSEKPVHVNGMAVRRKLLASGDQISLSTRCRIKFELPHPASTSAVLTISGTRLPNSDARRVVLLDKAMVLGPGPNAHMRAEALSDAAILLVQDGRLRCRTGLAVTVDDRPMDRVAGLPTGARVRVGAVQFVMTAA